MCGASLDHLVGADEQRGRNGKTQRPRSLEVDDKLEFSWLLNWQVGGLLAFENPADINADLTERVDAACVITHQAAGHDKVACCVHRWDRMARRECDDLSEPAVVGGFLGYQQSADPQSRWAREDGVQLALSSGFDHLESEPERAGWFLHLPDHEFGTWVGRIYEKADHGRFG